MTVEELIKNVNNIENDYSVAFAKKVDNEFQSDSIVIIAEIDEESEADICEKVISNNPEFSYFQKCF